MTIITTKDRSKLGLALAGGGFRASLFHLGVLRRLQETQVLRYVEVLSTVSGGSIIGALYVLYLKNAIDKAKVNKGQLDDHEFKKILDDVERILIKGIQKNLRNHLFINPFGWLKMFIFGESLSKRMARLYERYLYKDVVKEIIKCQDERIEIEPKLFTKVSRWLFPGRLSIRDLRFYPPEKDLFEIGFGNYVTEQLKSDKCTVPVQLKLNATSLNSGAPFYFSSVEIGDPRLGFIRGADMKIISACRSLLENGKMQLKKLLDGENPELQETLKQTFAEKFSEKLTETKQIDLALWWLRRKAGETNNTHKHDDWEKLFKALKGTPFPESLLNISFGRMRQMKLAAWYLLIGYQNQHTGGLTKEQHCDRFWNNMRHEQRELEESLKKKIGADPKMLNDLLEFVLWTYYFRSTEIIASNIHDDWKKITIGDAVGASACFPPVFSPYEFFGIYDDTHVSRLGLTDGGVYDNAGITTLLDANCTHIIVSDTGGMFDINQRATKGRVGMMGRIASILMDDVAEQQRNNLRERHSVTDNLHKAQNPPKEIEDLKQEYNLHGLVYFHINSPPVGKSNLDLSADPNLLAELRTDLDGFGDVEVNALVNQGYDVTDRYIQKFFKKEASKFKQIKLDAKKELPKPLTGWEEKKEEVNDVLKAGKLSLFRALKLNIITSWVFTLLLATAIIYTTWNIEISISELINKGMGQIMAWLETSMPFFGTGWTNSLMPLGMLLLIAALLLIIVIKLKPKLEQWMEKNIPKTFRTYLKIAKLAHRTRANILWLAGYLPVLIAVGLSIVFFISYLFYYLPFRYYTRVKKKI